MLDYNIMSNKYSPSIKKMIKFELISLFGRTFLNKKPKNKNVNLLNLGCGGILKKEFINADFFVVKGKRKKNLDWMLDLRYPLNCNDCFFDGIICEHVLEHILPSDAFNLLKELFRVLKKGSILRITVPDLKKYVDYYDNRNYNLEFKKWATGCEAIRSLTQNWGHVSVWDEELLHIFLKKAGFNNIKKQSYKKGSDKRLLIDLENRKWETLYLEAQKV